MGLYVQFMLLVIAVGNGCQAHSESENQVENRLSLLESKVEELTNKLHNDSKYNNLTINPSSKAIDPTQLRLNNLEANVTELKNQLATINSKLANNPEPVDLSPVSCTRPECRKVTVLGRTFKVLFESNEYGRDWIVLQSRYNGSVDFYRNWTDYRAGFGSMDGEFWLGLETIHWLTSAKNYDLLILLENFNGVKKYARYGQFAIGGEWEGYSFKALGSYSGTAGDSLTYNKGQKFSTFDKEQDLAPSRNCAVSNKGAWWYNDCSWSNLNALYQNEKNNTAMYWYGFNSDFQGMKITKMMIGH